MGASRARAPLLVLSVVASGGALLNCLSWLNFGERKYHIQAGNPVTAEEAASIRAMWIAGARMADERFAATLASLVRGDVFVADAERSPRAMELLAYECGPFTTEQRAHFDAPVVPKPLLDTNPAACEELRTSALPEAFSVRYEGNVLHWYYFTYEDRGYALRVREIYSKMPLKLVSEWSYLDVVNVPDVGRFPMWYPNLQNTWGGPNIDTYDSRTNTYHPNLIIASLRHARGSFRRSIKRLEVDVDAGQ